MRTDLVCFPLVVTGFLDSVACLSCVVSEMVSTDPHLEISFHAKPSGFVPLVGLCDVFTFLCVGWTFGVSQRTGVVFVTCGWGVARWVGGVTLTISPHW